MKKVLFVANHKGFSKFNAPFMAWFKEQGWQVDNASPGIEVRDFVDFQYDVYIQRSPFSKRNIKAYKQLKEIIERNNYDIIHVHTPMGAVLGRLAAIKARRHGSRVIYTAHGFHFFKGAPLKNWVLYYPIEKLLAKYTDTLVTINNEDFLRAKQCHLYKNAIYHINGVGVDLNRFHPLEPHIRTQLRQSLGLNDSDFVALYTAQFIPRKNHRFIIENLPTITKHIPNFKMIFAGSGETMEYCITLSKKNKTYDNILFLGGRNDIPDLCGIADIHISPSLQEGLAIGNIEAMAAGCSLVLSNIRGHTDVCENNINGFLFNLDRPDQMIDAIKLLVSDPKLRSCISQNNINKSKVFDVNSAVKSMAEIYKQTELLQD